MYVVQQTFLDFFLPERGVEYEFRVSAKNSVDYGEPSSEKLTTPDGSELFNFIVCAFVVFDFL